MTENDLARVIYINEQRRLLLSLQNFLANYKCYPTYCCEVKELSERKKEHEIPKIIMEDLRALVKNKITEISDEIKAL